MTESDILGDDLLSVAAHDLKGPIGAVRGYIELMRQAGSLNETQMRFYDRAMDGLKRMEGLIADLLEFAALEKEGAVTFTECDLKAIVRSVVDLVQGLAEQRQITISVTMDDDLAPVTGDQRLLEHVLNNLLTNAIKYNHDQGQVWVQVTNQPDFVRVDVGDNGMGIPGKDQPFVFDRFFRAANSAQSRMGGSGLGLTIVKAIIQKHQGYIWLKSTEGEGSVFSFTIPRKDRLDEGLEVAGRASRESSDVHSQRYHDLSIEEADDIDDNMQEARDSQEIDSSSDVV